MLKFQAVSEKLAKALVGVFFSLALYIKCIRYP